MRGPNNKAGPWEMAGPEALGGCQEPSSPPPQPL